MLINISNHHSSHWSERQKQEAVKLYGEIVDIPFPDVDESGDEEYIAELSEEYLYKVKEYESSDSVLVVHLMGEMTFTFSLVKLLQLRGITCVASTTKRLVKDVGKWKKEVLFEFERFRKYE